MIDITVIIGLPGSGKTRLAQSMADDDTVVLDDLSLQPGLMDDFVKKPKPKLIVTDPITAKPEVIRSRLAAWMGSHQHTVTILAFSNEPERCFENIVRRHDDRIIEFGSIQRQSLRYQPELYDKVIPVYAPQ